MILDRFGDSALRARLPTGANVRAVLAALKSLPQIRDAVVTPDHALVVLDGPAPEGLASAIEHAARERHEASPTAHHTIAVRYDGADLVDVARLAGLSVEETIRLHAAPTYHVAAVGFLPGFAYLTGIDPRLRLPRRPTPRARVPALAVAIAGPYSGIYPFASPGGWNLVGTALGFSPFDAQVGATLAVGDTVGFEEVRR